MNIKNRFIYFLFIIVMCFTFVEDVFAAGLDFTISATADKLEVPVGGEVKVKVKIKSDSDVDTCTFRTEYSSTLTELSGKAINSWETGFESIGGVTESYVLTNKNASADLSNGVEILELTYKVNGDGTLTIITDNCIEFVNENKGTFDNVNIDFKVEDLTNVTTLSSITVTNGVVTNFKPDNYKPFISLNNPVFGLAFTTTNPDYQDFVVVTDTDGNNVVDLNNITFVDDNGDGIMTLYVTVNNATKYELGIKYENKNLDNSLSSLKVNGKTVDLVDGKYGYVVNIEKNLKEVVIDAMLSDSENFQFVPGNGPGTFTIFENKTTIALVIEPKDKSSGVKSAIYILDLVKEGTAGTQSSSKPSNSSSSSKPIVVPSSRPSYNGNATTNPPTGNIFIFFIVIILLASIVGSIFIYRNNLKEN